MLRLLSLFLALVLQAVAKPYVTCEFQGQLGNQLFQAAAVIAYALDHDYIPVFPSLPSAMNGHINQQFVMFRLNTAALPRRPSFVEYYQDHHTHYTRSSPVPDYGNQDVRLHGYYQAETYFAHHADTIRNLFAPSEALTKQIEERYGATLKSGPTIAVHVRTFIPDARNPDIDGTGGGRWDYFVRALELFPKEYPAVVFSDAPGWTKSRFPKVDRQVYFIEGNSHYIDFYFMSLCTHQVVSPESTFSWWAAWLNRNPNKIVIAPSTWAGRHDNETVPPGWIKLELFP